MNIEYICSQTACFKTKDQGHQTYNISSLRDWSLITGWGWGYKMGGGRACEVLPLQNEGAEKVLAMLRGGGGHKKFWGSFYAVASSCSHIEGGHKKFPLFKREKVLSCLEGGGGGAQQVSDMRFSHLVAPPPPPYN